VFDEYEQMYQEAIDGLDVKYVDGEAYMSIHTVDIINESLLNVVEQAAEAARSGEPTVPFETVQGMLWVMSVWASVHDELEVRAEATTIPDIIPENFDKE
jgi:hypothetical protein